jgi:hypothetical protein
MLELSALALAFRLASIGYAPVIATRVVAAGIQTLHAFLADPDNYDGAADVRPSSSTRVVAVRVRLRPRVVLRYTWMLIPGRGTTEVDLAAQVESRGLVVRLALLLGGRRWLRRRVEAMLAALADRPPELAVRGGPKGLSSGREHCDSQGRRDDGPPVGGARGDLAGKRRRPRPAAGEVAAQRRHRRPAGDGGRARP